MADLRPSEGDTGPLLGLSEAAASDRLRAEGPNELPSAKPPSLLALGAEVVREPMLLLLIATGGIYLLLGDLEEALALLAAIFFVVGITLYQEQKTERTLHALRDLSSPRALVIRGGVPTRIAGRDLVRDDVVALTEGDRVPADASVLSCTNLRVDESLLTGESVPVHKRATDGPRHVGPSADEGGCAVYSGTLVVGGSGTARVSAIGANTRLGSIGKTLSSLDIGRTALQIEVGRLVGLLALLGLSACVVVAVLYGLSRHRWLDGALAGLTLAISMVPEEFPVILTVFLALGAWRISRSRVLTRRFPAIETLGSATVLCVDKTGTLTLNQMAVAAVDEGGEFRDLAAPAPPPLSDGIRRVIELGILSSKEKPFDPMERAFLDFSRQHRMAATRTDWTLLREYPLSDDLLAVANVWRRSPDSPLLVAVKGAPEALVELCDLGAPQAADVFRRGETMASRGLRVLGVARAEWPPAVALPQTARAFRCAFLGLVGLADPVRPGVPSAVQKCHDAGIRVVMLTGDYPTTALHIASQIGLARPDQCMTGSELARMDDATLARRVRTVDVFARVVPDQKLRLVAALKSGGDVVAMTGDGVNDAPALKAADIGIAMGSRGTDVAREAAALVLLDDDFTSIVRAVRLGRRIYDNIKKAMSYALAIHVPIAGMVLIPVVFRWPLVLLPVHVIFMEMIVDPACSIAFEMEPEEADIMKRPPRDPSRRLFEPPLVFRSLLQGASALAIALAVLGGATSVGLDSRDSRTLTFTTLIITNLSLIFANRSLAPAFMSGWRSSNPALWALIAAALLTLAIVLSVPAMREVFQLAPLHGIDMIVCAAAGVIAIVWMELLKLVRPRRSVP